MKKYKNGLVLGKFFPLHKGHCLLIETAMERCEKLTILVCTLKSEDIPGVLRFNWVKDMYPTANVVHITKNAPMRVNDLNVKFENDADDFFWGVWIDLIRQHVKEIDVFFTSEKYGEELVQKLNDSNLKFDVVHESVDNSRTIVPISGTAIRKDPFANWEYIPDIVKSYFAKKIAIVGPESTGKTVMTEKLAKYYNTSFVSEFGREYTADRYMGLDTKEFHLHDISFIVSNQLSFEEEALQKSNKLFFSDTETITTEIWSEIYFKRTPQWVRDINKLHPHNYSFYFLLDIDVPWVDDGTRYLGAPEQRKMHFEMIRDELILRDVPFAIINGNGNYEDRFEKIVNAIKRYVMFDK